ncbi:EKC/KEOPS complex subunit Tprkb [Leptinotarsa decemlineata]|uniref:EKC/KEOPS complex subunit Tprkb n=1 Tax=Leptinotarsa decemlineata TaxID=7539 RepID=UPI000C251C1A|nr:EKC/KEOPS complex subunit Tprkb-like [Leptinotarsa decemlineata]
MANMNLDPVTKSRIDIKLYKNVKNMKQLKEKLLKGELTCSLVKPSLICDPFQIIVAANKALTSEKLTTKSVYTEILFNLSISKNISNSLQTFGSSESDKELLVVTVNEYADVSNDSKIHHHISGEEIPIACLSDYCDISLIRKVYKVNSKEYNVISLLNSIVSRISTKDFLSH